MGSARLAGTGRDNEKAARAMQPTPIKPTISGENPVHTTIGSKAVLCTAQPRTGEALSASERGSRWRPTP